jgi:hypothetical protein
MVVCFFICRFLGVGGYFVLVTGQMSRDGSSYASETACDKNN